MKVYYYPFNTELGRMWIAFTNKGLVKVSFPSESKDSLIKWFNRYFKDIVEYKEKEEIYSQEISRYLDGSIRSFNLPIDLHGTEFQKKVWNQLLEIPYGEVRTYKDIAIGVGSNKGFRAVGGANNRNPIPIVIPCHRVVGNNGDMVGFGGEIHNKVKLLRLEGHNIVEKISKGAIKYTLKK